MEGNENNFYYVLFNNKTTFIVIRDFSFEKEKIIIKENPHLTLVFDFENLSKKLDPNKVSVFIKYINSNNNTIKNIIIKNCLVQNFSRFFDLDLKLDLLYISDELYSMSPNLNILFGNLEIKKLVLKKMKINSKYESNNFFEFIFSKIKCEELELEDIFIELIMQDNKEDEDFKDLDQYITFENGEFYMIKNNEPKKLNNLKKLKMIDCPLFSISEETFIDKNNRNDISIDIDGNSLIDPGLVTKFKINEGLSEICFDLDSFKLDMDEDEDEDKKKKDYINNLKYIFENIILNNENIKYKKIKFKNFDMTKYEYITGENLTFIDEGQRIFNKKEKERAKKFEEFNNYINNEINNNKNIFSEIKELIFDNCSNHFIQIILKFILTGNNNKLEYLKLKKCGKEYFDMTNILSLKLKKLILFDIPLLDINLDKFTNNNILENLTITISCLEYYCKSNNLDYYQSMEMTVKIITNKNFNKHICFEMNALPSIMTFLVAKKINEEKKATCKSIPTYFQFLSEEKDIKDVDKDKKKEMLEEANKKRKEYKAKSFELKKLNKNTITLRRNNIKNKLGNYEIYYLAYLKLDKEEDLERGKNLKSDFGKDIFNLDEDYRYFFKYNQIKNIIVENCLFTNFKSSQKIKIKKQETIINLIDNSQKNYIYTFDMQSLNEIFFKNKDEENITFFIRYLNIKDFRVIDEDTYEYLLKLSKKITAFIIYIFYHLIKYLHEIKIVFNNIKEKKEFFCLLCVYDVAKRYLEQKGKKEYEIFDFNSNEKYGDFQHIQEQLIKRIGPYFLKKKDENNEDIYSNVFNYYYTSEEENKIFGDFKNTENNVKEIAFASHNFTIEYKFDEQWDIIMK